ncbi:phosphotyrosine protein phosphatase [Ectothiorhodospira shaposhnikovii]|uniref:low molecular weight protein-tyrosine-phosphatase n=1 Tax=Ectothiorhodospira shaposhnikovii TaxID=1054 RepID=UPI001905EDD7|nr:low molecular weight protein-tyrosine-phosphatase [Ectothiorhodospira shaposhnikovii]MBK1674017.1 phosphotyrosine protein phosphatase [Ectothiorhodospira shaposhnikovii]
MKVSVLFVCMGNICRSPLAQGVFEHHLARAGLSDVIHVDSAGTHAYHVGEPPDERARRTAQARGIDLSAQRARRMEREDLDRFDYVLVMDRDNLESVRRMGEARSGVRLSLLMEFGEGWSEKEVPDPYYGGSTGFERVMDMVEDAALGLLNHIRISHDLSSTGRG